MALKRREDCIAEMTDAIQRTRRLLRVATLRHRQDAIREATANLATLRRWLAAVRAQPEGCMIDTGDEPSAARVVKF